jgi:hypothetical protein
MSLQRRGFRIVLLTALFVGIIAGGWARESPLNNQLVAAVRKGDTRAVAALLKQGANPNTTDKDGDPVIRLVTEAPVLYSGVGMPANGGPCVSWTVYKGYEENVRLLVKYGANVNVRNRKGKTPLMQAWESGQGGIADFLERSGAKRPKKSS